MTTDRKIDDGGPAFPQPDVYHANGEIQFGTPGMTLRDYFAAKAMQGFNKLMVDYGWSRDVLVAHAEQAYAVADAMMEARK